MTRRSTSDGGGRDGGRPAFPGTTSGFAGFFDDFYPTLVRAMYLLCGSASEAEDLAQEAMARVFERWTTVSTMASPHGYAITTARNELRRRRRRSSALLGRLAADPGPEPDVASGVDASLDVRAVLQRLSLADRTALVFVEYLGFTPDEAATALGITAGAFRVRLHRARRRFRRLSEDRDG